MTENMLTKGLNYKGIVQSITPCVRTFPNKHTGNTDNCHDVILKVDGFPELFFKTQICNTIRGIPDFEINDYILFKVSAYYMAEDRYTIKFESKAFKPAPKKETIGAKQPDTPSKPPYDPPSYPDKRIEPAIMGTKWSICLTAAKDFHKDRKTSKDADVIATLKAYMRSFNEYQANEEEYLKESK